MTKRLSLLIAGMTALVAASQDAVFRADVHLVEIYATVQDHRGHYVEGLTKDRFSIMDGDQAQEIVAFEPESVNLSCALLLDTTGSMRMALPSVKNAAVSFLGELRPTDLAAVYSFSSSLDLLQDFTLDHEALKRAVQGTHVGGQTALFDSIAQVAHDVSARQGKKVMVVFTDGGDNASALQATGRSLSGEKNQEYRYIWCRGQRVKEGETLKLMRAMARFSGRWII